MAADPAAESVEEGNSLLRGRGSGGGVGRKMKETLCYVAADPAAESVGCGPRGSGGGVGRPGGGRVGISSPNHAWEK